MPINPLIALQAKAPDLTGVFSGILSNLNQAEQLAQARELTPAKRRLLEAQAEGAEAELPTEIEQLNTRQKQLISSVAGVSRQIIPDLQAGNIERVRKTLQDRLVDLQNKNLPTRETEEGLALLDTDPQELIRQSQNAIILDERANPVKKGQASAKTEILESGATIQALPSGEVVVKDPLGNTVSGQARTDVIREAQQAKVKAQQQRADITVSTARRVEQVKKATATADKAFGLVDSIRSNIDNLNEVVSLVGEGADTGPISQFFPSFRAASIKLDQLQNRLGLDVVGATTFGALSKGELDLARDVALPKALKGPALISWVNERVAAQTKLANYYEEQAIFLNGDNTQADWLKFKRKELKDLLNNAGATPDNIKQTMKDNNMTRSEVIQELKRRASGGR